MVFFSSYRGKSGFGDEITYKGISGNVITLTYNQWDKTLNFQTQESDLTNKPNDFQYTLDSDKSKPTDITVTSYKIRIIEANNNTITFILLAGMLSVESD